MTKGGVAVPSPPCAWRISSPLATVAAAANVTIRGTTTSMRVAAPAA
jgi:hypothetical protein